MRRRAISDVHSSAEVFSENWRNVQDASMASSSQVVQPIPACSSSAAWQSTQQDCRAHLSADPAARRPPARVCASLEKAKATPHVRLHEFLAQEQQTDPFGKLS